MAVATKEGHDSFLDSMVIDGFTTETKHASPSKCPDPMVNNESAEEIRCESPQNLIEAHEESKEEEQARLLSLQVE